MGFCFMFSHANCPDCMLLRIEQAMPNGEKRMVFTLKMWQKIVLAALVIVMIIGVVWYFSQEQKNCCLCSSFRFHAPCLIDLETGEMMVLDLYFPHETKVAELADPQPEMGTFSFVSLGDVKGTKLTDSKTIELVIPTKNIINPALCKSCWKKLGGLVVDRYVLADLYSSEDRSTIQIEDGLCMDLRCYHITVQRGNDVLKLVIQGILEPENLFQAEARHGGCHSKVLDVISEVMMGHK